jgi:hypothetical protein
MNAEGVLVKMYSEHKSPVEYSLAFADNSHVFFNDAIGKNVTIDFAGDIFCLACGKKIKKSYGQGYCYPCFVSVPEAEECVLHPELCRAHEGIARNMEWAQNHCLQEHVVYLAETSIVKVGVTRGSQVPTRWIDQGAARVLELARTPNRYEAGRIEVFLKAYLADKTNWRDMLTNKSASDGLLESTRERIILLLPNDMRKMVVESPSILKFQYPVNPYPAKITSMSFDKQPHVEGKLVGIRGQYLMFEGGKVVNLRSHSGYFVKVAW